MLIKPMVDLRSVTTRKETGSGGGLLKLLTSLIPNPFIWSYQIIKYDEHYHDVLLKVP